jgi:1,4-alpha-glucan branching enzyme
MPGLATPIDAGGIGFDFRLAMGVPDFWVRLVKEYPDESWPMGHLWYELNNRRYDEKSISYAESHDQALVGDQTLMFRMAGAAMYHHMCVGDLDATVERAVALHKLMRFITLAAAGHGYQSFMGNEFGHPEWIDFPRTGNGWSYHYARRQWHLADDPNLKYRFLQDFDREMIALVKRFSVLDDPWPYLLYEHNDDKVIAFARAGLVFVFNFHPTRSHADYAIHAPAGKYTMILNSDDAAFGGYNRLSPGQTHFTLPMPNTKTAHRLFLYLPTRTALVLKPNGV